jgi:polyhydroxybutyrate depolymerase
MTRLILSIFIIATLSPVFAQDAPKTSPCPPHQTTTFDAENNRFQMEVDGLTREYLLYVPKSYDPEKPMPLVIAFPAGLQTPEAMAETSKWHVLGEQVGFITAYPAFVDLWWNDGVVTKPDVLEVDDINFVKALIEDIAQKWCVDRDHIFASGGSNGGNMSARLACEMSDQIAAVGTVAGGAFPLKAGCKPQRPIPHIVFYGTADDTLPYEGGDSPTLDEFGFADLPPVEDGMKAWAKLNECDLNPTENAITGEISVFRYTNCERNAEVRLFRIEGGGHDWPGSATGAKEEVDQEIDATLLTWAFFVAHTATEDISSE